MQLGKDGAFVSVMSYSPILNFTAANLGGLGTYTVKYVFTDAADGVISTQLTAFGGYVTDSHAGLGLLNTSLVSISFPVTSAPLTVETGIFGTPTNTITQTYTPTITETFTKTNTITQTYTPTNTGTSTNTPTGTWFTSTPTMTPLVIVMAGIGPINGLFWDGSPANVPMMQFMMTNPSNVPVTLTRMILSASGTGNDATGVSVVSLYSDTNSDGIIDANNSISSGSYTQDNGAVTLNFLSVIPAASSSNYLINYDFTRPASLGTYQISLPNNASVMGVGEYSQPLSFYGAPVTGVVQSLIADTMTVTATPSGTWFTSTPANTGTSTFTGTPTWTPTVTDTFTVTNTITHTYTPTNTDTSTNTPTGTWFTSTPTQTNTETHTVTNTSTASVTFTTIPSDTPTSTPTITPTAPVSLTPLPTPLIVAYEYLTPGVAAIVALSDGSLISVPAGALTVPVSMMVSKYSTVTAPSLPSAPQFQFLSSVYFIDTDGVEPLAGSSVTITFPYSPSDIPSGETAADLEVIYYNGTAWVNLPTIVNTSTQTVTVVTDHFSWWAVVLPQSTPVPTANHQAPVLYPNPVKHSDPVLIHLNTGIVSDVKVQVYTLSFRKIEEFTVPHVAAGGDVVLELADKWNSALSNGLYYVRVTTAERTSTLKLLVIK